VISASAIVVDNLLGGGFFSFSSLSGDKIFASVGGVIPGDPKR
jgi:hypothetical protein